MPSIDAETLAQIKTSLELGEELGTFISQLADGPITHVAIQYNGKVAGMAIDPITISILKGMLKQTIDGVNMVNAPYIAKERGIEVKESRSTEVHEYTSTIEVRITTKNGERSVTGSNFGKGDSRIVKIDEFNFEALLSKHMLVLKNMDVPGVIGNLGQAMGNHQINIAGFHLGRLPENNQAIAIINIDSAPTSETLRELRDSPNIISINSVSL